VIDIAEQNFLEREFLEHIESIWTFPTIMIDGERLEGNITRKQIKRSYQKHMLYN